MFFPNKIKTFGPGNQIVIDDDSNKWLFSVYFSLFNTFVTVYCFLLIFPVAVFTLSYLFIHFSYGFEIYLFAQKLQVIRRLGTSYQPPPAPEPDSSPNVWGSQKRLTEPAPRRVGDRGTLGVSVTGLRLR